MGNLVDDQTAESMSTDFTDEQTEAFTLLNQLRAAGVINMLGAAPWLQEQLGVEINHARRLHREWMFAIIKDTWDVHTGVTNPKRQH